MRTHYDVLGVSPEAGWGELHGAYRAQARRLHPDAGAGDAAAMRELNEAWAVLRDPTAREEYDAALGLDVEWDAAVAAVHGFWTRRAPVVAVLAVLLAIFVLSAYAAVPTSPAGR